jgi:hypothetical protein
MMPSDIFSDAVSSSAGDGSFSVALMALPLTARRRDFLSLLMRDI